MTRIKCPTTKISCQPRRTCHLSANEKSYDSLPKAVTIPTNHHPTESEKVGSFVVRITRIRTKTSQEGHSAVSLEDFSHYPTSDPETYHKASSCSVYRYLPHQVWRHHPRLQWQDICLCPRTGLPSLARGRTPAEGSLYLWFKVYCHRLLTSSPICSLEVPVQSLRLWPTPDQG